MQASFKGVEGAFPGNAWAQILELHSLKLQSGLAPHLHCLLQEYSDDEGEEDLMPSFDAQAV